MLNKRHLFFAVVALFVVAVIWWSTDGEGACRVKTTTKTINGDSLSGLAEDGQRATVKEGYYFCNEVLRGDMVIYRYAGTTPLIKVVSGVAGDVFALQKVKDGQYYLLLNNQVAQNSQGRPYLLGADQHQMLSLYVRDFKGVIPKDSYLILGNLTGGSSDSTEFGLVSKTDFIGKVTRIR